MSLHRHIQEAGMPLPRGQELFLLMEAATQQELLARMAFHDVAHRCLWRAGDLHGMETRAPWLAQVESGSRFDEWAGGARESLAFTLIPASLSFDGLWRHLRRFAKFEADGRRYFLRLGDPGSLRMYTASLAAQPDAVTRFFARGDIQQYYFHDPCAGLARLVRPVFESGVDADERDGCLVWRDVPREAA